MRAWTPVAAGGLLLLLGGCSGTSEGQLATLLYRSTIGGGKVERATAAAVPYASIGVEVGSSVQSMMVLGTETAGELDWFGSDGAMIATRNGRIVLTGGLPRNLGRLANAAGAPTGPSPVPGTDYTLLFDFPDYQLYRLAAKCHATDEGPERIAIIGTEIDTRHILEDCDAESVSWSFENEFWLDTKTGYAWRSIQHVHPKLSAITIEVFRPEEG